LIGGNTFVVVPVPTDWDGERVEVLMTERICGDGKRQHRASTALMLPVILSLSKDPVVFLAAVIEDRVARRNTGSFDSGRRGGLRSG
jgi:hypothetical protein